MLVKFLRYFSTRRGPSAFYSYKNSASQSSNLLKGKYAFLVFPVTFLGLGIWQTKRRQWKIDLISTVKQRLSSIAKVLPESLDDLLVSSSNAKDHEYTLWRIQGRFLHDREQYISTRKLIAESEQLHDSGLLSTSTITGYQVVTPLRLSGRDDVILVNRGWVPNSRLDPSNRKEGLLPDEVDFVGVLRTSDPRQPFEWMMNKKTILATKELDASTCWLRRDVEGMALAASRPHEQPVKQMMVDVKERGTTFPIGGQTRLVFRNEHFNYMLTWYTLSLCSGLLWISYFMVR